jgi:predicted dinucleotide-binding enzyme
MKISVIGTGMVGRTLALKLVEVGHEVIMGTRNVSKKLADGSKDRYGNPPLTDWLRENNQVKLETFATAASAGEIVINATHGSSSIEALKMAGAQNLAGKILIDVSNPLDFSKEVPGLLPGLNNTNSLGEEIQKIFPYSLVVKTLNTIWCGLMVDPGMIEEGSHVNFISGNDVKAKEKVKALLNQLGWKDDDLFDLGDITGARAAESMMHIWLRIRGVIQTGAFNFRIVRQVND